MLTKEEIGSLAVNLEVAREAHKDVEKRLIDVLDVRKTVEQKATTLFGFYITIALALFGVGGALLRETSLNLSAWPFMAAGGVFVAGAVCFIWANWPMTYGFLGSNPSMWLVRGRVDGGPEALADMLAFLVHDQEIKIKVSWASNAQKVLALRCGMAAAPVGAAVLMIGLLITGTAAPTFR